MQVIKKYDQYRRDLYIDIKCEDCGATQIKVEAYDDSNFWANVVPKFKCEECGKSSNDLGIAPKDTSTKYPEGFQI